MKKLFCGNLTQQSQISSSTTTKPSHKIIICNTTTTLKQNTFSHVPQHAPPTQILQENQHQIPYQPPSSPLPFHWYVEGFIPINETLRAATTTKTNRDHMAIKNILHLFSIDSFCSHMRNIYYVFSTCISFVPTSLFGLTPPPTNPSFYLHTLFKNPTTRPSYDHETFS